MWTCPPSASIVSWQWISSLSSFISPFLSWFPFLSLQVLQSNVLVQLLVYLQPSSAHPPTQAATNSSFSCQSINQSFERRYPCQWCLRGGGDSLCATESCMRRASVRCRQSTRRRLAADCWGNAGPISSHSVSYPSARDAYVQIMPIMNIRLMLSQMSGHRRIYLLNVNLYQHAVPSCNSCISVPP